jgi:hypothetical protein
VGFRAAYGTEKHEHYFVVMGERAAKGELDALELEHLRDELAAMAATGPLPKALRDLPAKLAQASPKVAAPPPAQPTSAAPATGGAR